MKVYVWPDLSWCTREELAQVSIHKEPFLHVVNLTEVSEVQLWCGLSGRGLGDAYEELLAVKLAA